MDWIDWVMWVCIFIAGYGVKGAVDQTLYLQLPRPRHEWECQRCPMRLGSDETEALNAAVSDHMHTVHGVDL